MNKPINLINVFTDFVFYRNIKNVFYDIEILFLFLNHNHDQKFA